MSVTRTRTAVATLDIAQEGRSWAIKHDGGYLGYVRSHDEALKLVKSLRAARARFNGQGIPPDRIVL